jgi:hypothetical protein
MMAAYLQSLPPTGKRLLRLKCVTSNARLEFGTEFHHVLYGVSQKSLCTYATDDKTALFLVLMLRQTPCVTVDIYSDQPYLLEAM